MIKFFSFFQALFLFSIHASDIAIVDFGSQTTHLISRRLRDMGIESHIVPPEHILETLPSVSGVILSGSPASVHDEGAPKVDPSLFHAGIPILGICYGWQLMAHALGGSVERSHSEYGIEEIAIDDRLLGLPKAKFPVVVSHGDSITSLPPGFTVIGSTERVNAAAAVNRDKKWMGLQFHPEMEHTVFGSEILRFFATDFCQLSPTVKNSIDLDSVIQKIQNAVGEQDEVICAVSGGVDSTVAAFLIAQAIGKRMHAVYVDTDLMRPGTREKVSDIFTHHVNADLIIVDANERFMQALEGVRDPESKRKLIGKLYVDIFQEVAATLKGIQFLAQGTIYSDVIESKGSSHASKIKSHHNVGGLPENLSFRLLEPLREFYKDEVRKLGFLAGLPLEYVQVHPFPGPGYGIRIRGEVTQKRLMQIRGADAIIMEEVQKARLYDQVFQCFAVMTGAYSTAVKGDGRAFEEVVAIRAYESLDVMTANWAKLPYSLLEKISRRIVGEVPGISRVVYDITDKPPATMEWE